MEAVALLATIGLFGSIAAIVAVLDDWRNQRGASTSTPPGYWTRTYP